MYEELRYSEQNIALIRTAVENQIKTHEDFYYSVKVNGLAIVPKSRDITLFDSFRDHVNDETKTVTFIYYSGLSRGGDTVTLLVNGYSTGEKQPKVKQETGLSGLDKDEIKKQIFNEVENDFLRKENERLKKELAKAEKFIKEVDVLIAQLRAQKDKVKDKGTLEYIGNFVSKVTTAFPDLLGNGNMIESLMGLLPKSEEKKESSQEISGPDTVTIKQKAETLDPDTKELLQVLKSLRKYFSEIEFKQCLALLYAVKDHKELIAPVNEWIREQIEEKLRFLEMMKKRKASEKSSHLTVVKQEPETEVKQESEIEEIKPQEEEENSEDDKPPITYQ